MAPAPALCRSKVGEEYADQKLGKGYNMQIKSLGNMQIGNFWNMQIRKFGK
jgi:hypothetical protein